jgi:hypothetical protein
MKRFEFNKYLRFHFAEGDDGAGGGGADDAGAGGGGGGGHWTDSQANFSPEMKTAFSKYDSPDAAFKGAHEAMTMVGKPFKLPDSLDKLDETQQQELTGQLDKLFPAMQDSDFDGFDFNIGLEDGDLPISDSGKDYIKKFAAETGLSKDKTEKMAAYVNTMNREIAAKQAEINQELTTKCNDAMCKHFGGQDQANAVSKQVMDAFKQRASSAEEFEAVGKGIVQAGLTKSPELAIALAEMIAPYGKEGASKAGNGLPGGDKDGPTPVTQQLPETGKALGW